MPGLVDDCERLYNTRNLYELLCISKTASTTQVKRAYHRLSLQVHPDRVSEADKEQATVKFQVLGKVYTILSDQDKRAIYDESGEVDDEDSCLSQDRDWSEYWRLLYAKISVDDIKQFEEKYKDSEEELEDLKAAYTDSEGDMDHILENVLCATPEDESRFTELIHGLIDAGELQAYDKFTKETDKKKKARKRKAAKEAQEAEDLRTELGIGQDDSLKALIAQRQQSRAAAADDFFSQLEAKYTKPKSKGKTSTTKR